MGANAGHLEVSMRLICEKRVPKGRDCVKRRIMPIPPGEEGKNSGLSITATLLWGKIVQGLSRGGLVRT